MTHDEKLQYYQNHYDLIFSGFYGNGYKIYIGEKLNPKKCRFCEKSFPETKFQKIAHTIPEFLGNHQLISNDECDSCNEFFSNNLELHLDKFTRPLRLIGQIKGKEKVPSFKTNNKKSRIDYVQGKGLFIKHFDTNDFTKIDEEKKEIEIPFQLESYVPSAVYKALCKIAISVWPIEKIHEVQITKRWILDPDHCKVMINPQILFVTSIPGPCPNPFVTVLLFLRKQDKKVPSCILVISFGNVAYQIHVPTELDKIFNGSTSLNYAYFPTPFDVNWPFGKPKYKREDLTSCEVKKGQIVPVKMTFSSKVEIDPSQGGL